MGGSAQWCKCPQYGTGFPILCCQCPVVWRHQKISIRGNIAFISLVRDACAICCLLGGWCGFSPGLMPDFHHTPKLEGYQNVNKQVNRWT